MPHYATALAGEALEIRACVLRLLGTPLGHPEPPIAQSLTRSAPSLPKALSPRAWELFLRAERCALPLRRKLTALGRQQELPPELASALAILALEESQRIISAKAQLGRLSRWAAESGRRLVILKGAVAALDDRAAVDLADIDVWAAPGDDIALMAALSATGHTAKPHTSFHHHAARVSEQLVAVEVHHAIPHAGLDEGWMTRTEVHAALPALHRMAAADHLWHVLIHATVHHIDRRGRIRDLLLIAQALSLCTSAEREEARVRAADHVNAASLLAMLEMAERIEQGRPVEDAFPAAAAARYLHTVPRARRSRIPFLSASIATHAALDGWSGYRAYFVRVYQTRDTPAPGRALSAFQKRAPRLGTALVLSLRILKRVVALPSALQRARTARALAERASGPDSRGRPEDPAPDRR